MKTRTGIFSALVAFAALTSQGATVTGTVSSGGFFGTTGTPVAGAKVVLSSTGLTAGGGTAKALDSTVTDAKGKYAFAKVDTGYVQVAASMTGYQAGTGRVRVRANTGAYTVNINLTELPKPATISGTVRAGSSTGTPVVGAMVYLSRGFGGGGIGGGVTDSVKTNAQGQYTFANLAAPNTYNIRVTAAGYPNGTATVNTTTGGTSTADVVLIPIGASGKVAGKVTKASDGSAVSGARVIISGGGGIGGGFRADTVTTNAQGQYGYDSIPIGTGYSINVSAAGLQSAVLTGISVVYRQTTTADFALGATPTDTTKGSVSGLVTDASNKPLAKAVVILSSRGVIGGTAVNDTVVTGADGKFSFPSLAAGTGYRLTVTLTGYQSANRTLTVVRMETVIINITLSSTTSIGSIRKNAYAIRSAYFGNTLRLTFPDSPEPGVVRQYNAEGALLFSAIVAPHAAQIDVPAMGRFGFMLMQRGDSVERITVPATR